MKIKTSLLIALVAACIIPSLSHAGDKAPKGFTKLDADSSGSISQEEAAANKGYSKRFAKADADSDGSVSLAEYKAESAARAAKKKAAAAEETTEE
ncbi:MAG: hypothetical protein ACSHX8_04905 [Opitutaceae bacterium]